MRFPADRIQILQGILFLFVMDRISKFVITQWLEPGETHPVIPGVFHITRMQNTGAAFSLFYQHPEALTLLSALLFGIFLWIAMTKKAMDPLEKIGFVCILGGALGNLMDRLRWGSVTDFLDFTIIHYPVFNLADSFIFIGVFVLVWHYVRPNAQAAGS